MNIANALVPVETVLGPIRAALQHWRDLEPYEFRTPVPVDVIEAVMGVAVVEGDWQLMLFTLITAHCWLRPNETLNIGWQDITIMRDELITHGVVRIGHPKIKRPMQHVLIEASFVAAVLDAFKAAFGRQGGLVCTYSPPVLASRWRKTLVRLQIEKDIPKGSAAASVEHASKSLTVGGIRPGVATSDYLITQNTSRTMWRGRWMCPQTFRQYLQLGTYHLTAIELPERAKREVSIARNRWYRFVESIEKDNVSRGAHPPDPQLK
jgi:hypothetical protein